MLVVSALLTETNVVMVADGPQALTDVFEAVQVSMQQQQPPFFF